MSFAPIEQFPTAQALSMLSQAEGWASFIPNGYVPVLVNEDDFSDFNEEVAGEMRRIASHLVIPTALEDCRLPSLVVGNMLPDLNSPQQAFAHAQPAKPPRRPANSFILYRQSRQAGLIAAYPGISNNEVSRILGQMWKIEDPQTKQVKFVASIDSKLTQQFYQKHSGRPQNATQDSVSRLQVLFQTPEAKARLASREERQLDLRMLKFRNH